MSEVVLRARDVHVHYGATRALDGADLEVRAGTIHALVGENGAGKSTLLRAAVGEAPLHSGGLEVLGAPASGAGGAAAAEGRRVALAPQEISLCDDLSVAEAVTLGAEPRTRLGFVDRPAQAERARGLLARVGADLDPQRSVRSLGVSSRKQVQLARALLREPRLILFDEPTAALDAAAQAALARMLRAHVAEGGAAVWVSHRLDEVLALADRVSVLRDGRHVATAAAAELDADTLVRQMVGRDVPVREARRARAGDVLLDWAGPPALRVRRGEIVGLAGMVGSGRSRCVETIAATLRSRAALVPEERARKGAIPTFRVRENLWLPAPPGWLAPGRERARTAAWIERLAIRTAGPDAPFASLSGGNQQKVLLARALARAPELLLLDEPTQGVDVAAKRDIHARIREHADAGGGVLLASSELPELLELADRVLVLRAGRVAGELAAGEIEEARVVALASGVETAESRA